MYFTALHGRRNTRTSAYTSAPQPGSFYSKAWSSSRRKLDDQGRTRRRETGDFFWIGGRSNPI